MTGTPGDLPNTGGYAGSAWFQTDGTEYQSIDFMVRQILAGKAFSAIVKVMSVTGGGIGQPPFVSVQPMVNQIDGLGNQVPHGTIYNIPCFRLQGGGGAIVLDPVVGDTGQAIICDRDISAVKATGAISGPGSWRQHAWSDGCYYGGFLNGPATQRVEFSVTTGIKIVSPIAVTLDAPLIYLNGAVTQTAGTAGGAVSLQGPVAVTNDVVAEGKSLATHTHLEHGAGSQTAAPT